MKDIAEKGIKQAISKMVCLFLALLRGQLEAMFLSEGSIGRESQKFVVPPAKMQE